MLSYNRVIIAGPLARDPDIKETKSGKRLCAMTVAVRRSSNRQEEPSFVDVVAWDRVGELCAKYLAKGSGVLVEGKIEMQKWQDKDGAPRKSFRVIADEIRFTSPSGAGAPESVRDGFGRQDQPQDQPRGYGPQDDPVSLYNRSNPPF